MDIYGVTVADSDCRLLIDLLMSAGAQSDLNAAAAIECGLELNIIGIVALPPDERDAIMGVLDDPSDGLAELRDACADHRQRVP